MFKYITTAASSSENCE